VLYVVFFFKKKKKKRKENEKNEKYEPLNTQKRRNEKEELEFQIVFFSGKNELMRVNKMNKMKEERLK